LSATYNKGGAMKKLYQNIYLLTLFALLIVMSNQVLAVSAEQGLEEIAIINVTPVILEDLGQVRGLGGVIDLTNNTNNLEAILTDNDANNNITGYNVIDQGSFNYASGVFSIIQNTGNNVIIQDSTIITITITPN